MSIVLSSSLNWSNELDGRRSEEPTGQKDKLRRELERESHVTQRSISGALWRPRQIVLKTDLRYCDSVGHAVSAQRDYLARDLHTDGAARI